MKESESAKLPTLLINITAAMERPGSLLDAIDFWGDKSPSKTAMTFLDDAGTEIDSLTYSHLLRRSTALAAHLVDSVGLSKGKPCLLVYPPGLEFTVAYLACLRAGVIAVPCFPPDPRKLKKDLHMFTAIQGSSGATVALTSRSYNYAKKVCTEKSTCTYTKVCDNDLVFFRACRRYSHDFAAANVGRASTKYDLK